MALLTSDSIVGVKPSIKILRLLPSPTFIPGASTSKNSNLPKFTKLEFTTLTASVSVVSVLAGTGNVISSVPSNGTVFINLGVANFVARADNPLKVSPVILLTLMLLK